MSSNPQEARGFAIEALGIYKSFGGVPALKECDLRVQRGEIHALLGQNGAGKSTLVKIINGVHPHGSFEGVLRVNGEEVQFGSPAAARLRGIGYVPQEIEIFERLSIAENIFAGQLAEGWRIDWTVLRRRAARLLLQLGLDFDPASPVATLSAAQRHLVMIARALSSRPVVLVLDEPTASLSEPEIERLFTILKRLSADGVSIIYITHRLVEVLRHCDRASVLRDGKITARFDTGSFDSRALISQMSGRDVGTLFPERRSTSLREVLLSVHNLGVAVNGRKRVDGVSFKLHAGEILGIAGLLGAGRTELLSAISGVLPHSGQIQVGGKVPQNFEPAAARKAGIAFLTEDRKRTGMLFNLSIISNVTIGNLASLSRCGVVRRSLERKSAFDQMNALRVRAAGERMAVAQLSGGTQQKLLFARALMSEPVILLLDDPCKGVDAATRQEIYRLVFELADNGCGVIVTSSELEEVIGLADRCLVMREGRMVDTFARSEGDEQRVFDAVSSP